MAAQGRGRARLLREVDFDAIEVAGNDRRPGGRTPRWSADLKSWLYAHLSKHCNSVAEYRQLDELDVQALDAKSRKKVLTAFALLESTRQALIEDGANAVVDYQWKAFYDCLDRVRPLSESRRKVGRKGNAWLDEFIMVVAEAYRRARGNVSAESNRDGKLETPFLRVLRIAFQRLPKKLQSGITLLALDVRARRVIPLWRTRAELGCSFE